MRKILLILLISLTSFAQSYDPNRFLKLDPKVINLFTCSGMLTANNFNNWDVGILSDDQMIDSMTFNIMAIELGLLEKGISHYTEYMEDYNVYVEEGFEQIFDLLETESFTWDTQSEIDYCQYKLNDIILNQPDKVGNYSMEQFRGIVRNMAVERFNFIQELIDY
jgi:hypothetical protein